MTSKNNKNADVEIDEDLINVETIANDDNEVEEFVDLDSEGDELSGKDQIKKLREKIKKLEGEKQEYLNSWQRALADYKNREKEISEDKKEWGAYAVKRFAEDLLVVMDTYDSARSNRAAWEAVDQNWRAGIEYIFATFENKLKDQGFDKFGSSGEAFNPELHEGLGISELNELEEKAGAKENTVSQVIMSGYNYKGKLFRPAKVKVWGK
jgi:molecular chaperone GrpE